MWNYFQELKFLAYFQKFFFSFAKVAFSLFAESIILQIEFSVSFISEKERYAGMTTHVEPERKH